MIPESTVPTVAMDSGIIQELIVKGVSFTNAMELCERIARIKSSDTSRTDIAVSTSSFLLVLWVY